MIEQDKPHVMWDKSGERWGSPGFQEQALTLWLTWIAAGLCPALEDTAKEQPGLV